jgi:hypothetical protein
MTPRIEWTKTKKVDLPCVRTQETRDSHHPCGLSCTIFANKTKY